MKARKSQKSHERAMESKKKPEEPLKQEKARRAMKEP